MVRMRPLLSQEHAITSLTAGGGGNGAGDAPCLRKLMPAESPGQGSIEKSYLVMMLKLAPKITPVVRGARISWQGCPCMRSSNKVH